MADCRPSSSLAKRWISVRSNMPARWNASSVMKVSAPARSATSTIASEPVGVAPSSASSGPANRSRPRFSRR
jgi:hypothetical protein